MTKYSINEIKCLVNKVYIILEVETPEYYEILSDSATYSDKSSKIIFFHADTIRTYENKFIKCLDKYYEFRMVRKLPRMRFHVD